MSSAQAICPTWYGTARSAHRQPLRQSNDLRGLSRAAFAERAGGIMLATIPLSRSVREMAEPSVHSLASRRTPRRKQC